MSLPPVEDDGYCPGCHRWVALKDELIAEHRTYSKVLYGAAKSDHEGGLCSATGTKPQEAPEES